MRRMPSEEQQSVTGGAVWVCLTCGYVSHDHIFIQTAKSRTYDHEKKIQGA
ncbi:hypothetical protein [Atopobacter sp. AH10]|uniref:hypothetical protein n=1 Tax=Atopobacter sp. AH10 TaxID=2315861 RepID=UPI0013143918|nr:hypothetical protein [Atopobacter sp. AH10]